MRSNKASGLTLPCIVPPVAPAGPADDRGQPRGALRLLPHLVCFCAWWLEAQSAGTVLEHCFLRCCKCLHLTCAASFALIPRAQVGRMLNDPDTLRQMAQVMSNPVRAGHVFLGFQQSSLRVLGPLRLCLLPPRSDQLPAVAPCRNCLELAIQPSLCTLTNRHSCSLCLAPSLPPQAGADARAGAQHGPSPEQHRVDAGRLQRAGPVPLHHAGA